jgi:hypothetical protein
LFSDLEAVLTDLTPSRTGSLPQGFALITKMTVRSNQLCASLLAKGPVPTAIFQCRLINPVNAANASGERSL